MARCSIVEHASSRADVRGREKPLSSASLAIKMGKNSGVRAGVCWQNVSADPCRPEPDRLKCRAASASQGLGRLLGFNASRFALLSCFFPNFLAPPAPAFKKAPACSFDQQIARGLCNLSEATSPLWPWEHA